MKLPKKISPCPIIDAIVEIRFTTEVDRAAVYGIVYKQIMKYFNEVNSLPVLELPEHIRQNDPNLKYETYHQFSNDDYIFKIGPQALTISSYPEYTGWKNFFEQIKRVLNEVVKVKILKDIERVGIRYINFFKTNIFDNINIEVLNNNQKIDYKNTHLRFEVNHDKSNFKSTLQIANNAVYSGITGSVIDIDTYSNKNLEKFTKNFISIIDEGHIFEKELFFNTLNPDFLEKLNPEY